MIFGRTIFGRTFDDIAGLEEKLFWLEVQQHTAVIPINLSERIRTLPQLIARPIMREEDRLECQNRRLVRRGSCKLSFGKKRSSGVKLVKCWSICRMSHRRQFVSVGKHDSVLLGRIVRTTLSNGTLTRRRLFYSRTLSLRNLITPSDLAPSAGSLLYEIKGRISP